MLIKRLFMPESEPAPAIRSQDDPGLGEVGQDAMGQNMAGADSTGQDRADRDEAGSQTGGRKWRGWRQRLRPAESGQTLSERWRHYRLSGDSKRALSGGIVEEGTLRLAIDRALIFAHEFFLIQGWALGPSAYNLAFEVQTRKGSSESVAFRSERFDVNKTFELSRSFPNDRAGFSVFGRLSPSAGHDDRVLGLALSEPAPGTASGSQRRPFCVAPIAMRDAEAGDIWRALFESLRHHLAVRDGDLPKAVSLVNRLRARDVAQRASFSFPSHDGQAIDVLILARHHPEIAEMNATLIQQVLPPNARVFVAAVNRSASLQTSEFMASLPHKPGIGLQYLVNPVTLPSSFVINAFLRSDHAPSVAIILDDVFIGSCLADLGHAIASRQSIAVPRASQSMLTPTIPTPRLQTANGRLVDSFGSEVLNSPLTPLGAAVLHEKVCASTLPVQTYQGRGLPIEELYRRNFDSIAISERACLDVEMEDTMGEPYFFNRVLLAHATPENA